MATKEKKDAGDIIKRAKNDYHWKIVQLLGAGGYGRVYKVIQVNDEGQPIADSKEYAMKAEKKTKRPSSRLKIERFVMDSYANADPQDREHFPVIYDFGQTSVIKYIVMTLVGPSLEAICRNGIDHVTALQCSLHTLKAIEDLHRAGFLHRDIKPANFCVSVCRTNIFILDFGLARSYRLKDGTLRPPRTRTRMIGTPRYCPRASHLMQELSRKDDFESWFYMMLDFMDREHGVPWKGKPIDQGLKMKQRVFDQPEWITSVSSKIPRIFTSIPQYLNTLDFTSNVDWSYMRQIIMDYARDGKIVIPNKLDFGSTGTSQIQTLEPSFNLKSGSMYRRMTQSDRTPSKSGNQDSLRALSDDDDEPVEGKKKGTVRSRGQSRRLRHKKSATSTTTTTGN